MASRIAASFERLPFWGVLLAVTLAPLPFASYRPWAWSVLGVWIGVLLVANAASSLTRAQPLWTSRALLVCALFFSASVAFIAMQASCWTPAAWHHPVWQLVENLPDKAGCPTVSIDAEATWAALGRLLTYGGAFWLAAQIAGSSSDARRLVAILSLAIACYALYGLAMHFSGLNLVLWYRKWAYVDDVTGTFVNRNSFASFAGMGAVCCLGLVVHRLLDRHAATRGRGGLVHNVLDQLSRDHLYVAGFVVCATAVVLTASRAGVASTLLGLITLMVTAGVHHRTTWRSRMVGTAMVAAVVTLAVAAGGGQLMKRMEAVSEDAAARSVVIGTTVEAAMERPWLGVGYGTFEDAWTLYRPPGINRWFRQAHSTYAENLLEIGIGASAAIAVAVAIVLLTCVRGLVQRRRNGVFPSIAIAASIVPIAHSAVDFSLQMPAINLAVAVLLGIGMRQAYRTRKATADAAEDNLSDPASSSERSERRHRSGRSRRIRRGED